MNATYAVEHPLCRKPHIYESFEIAMRTFLICAAGARLIEIRDTVRTLILQK